MKRLFHSQDGVISTVLTIIGAIVVIAILVTCLAGDGNFGS